MPLSLSRCLTSASAVVSATLLSLSVQAQIVPDGTLGTQAIGACAGAGGTCGIINGTTRGNNLFHSLQQFSLPNGDVAAFITNPAIQNVIVRVTGVGQPFISNINGTIATLDPTFNLAPRNFFLLNPNGIVFGPNARIFVGGSFLASTAERMLFQDGTVFDTRNQTATPLLTVSVPVGLQMGQTPGTIQSRMLIIAGINSLFTDFALVGGDITLDNSTIITAGQRLELASVGELGTVGLRLNGDRLSLNLATGEPRRDITLSNQSRASAAAGNVGGDVVVTGRNILLNQGLIFSGTQFLLGNAATNQVGDVTVDATATLQLTQNSGIANTVDAFTTGQAGNVRVTAADIQMRESSLISAFVGGIGSAGNVQVTANSIDMDGIPLNGLLPSEINSSVLNPGRGRSGNVTVETATLKLTNGANISTTVGSMGTVGNVRVTANTITLDGTTPNGQSSSTIASQVLNGGRGRGGDVTVQTGSLSVTNGAAVSTNTFGNGNAGNVQVTANTITLDGIASNGQFAGGIGSQVAQTGTGNAGNIAIETGSLTVTNGALISATTLGTGNAGNIRVIGQTITLDNTASNTPFASGISGGVGFTGRGNGGDISVEADSLTLTRGAGISTGTRGEGNAGSVRVKGNRIAVDGFNPSGQVPSAINSATVSRTGGNGGTVTIEANSLSVTNGALVAVSTVGNGNAGSVRVKANAIALDGTSPDGLVPSTINSTATQLASGNGGDITLETETLSVTNGATISAGTAGTGNGGNVRVTANEIALDGTSPDGQNSSGLLSEVENTGSGRGGDITVQTDSLSVTNGAAVSASTFGNGNAGNIRAIANTITLDGTNPNGQLASRIASQVGATGSGRGGDISVETDSLSVTNRATVSSSAFGNGSAGNLDITAHNIRLDRGSITATSVSGDGANISLNVRDLLLLRYGSQISTTAGSDQFGGNGGNITINAPKGFIVGVKSENSDITANAFTGSGGRVNITTQGIYGLQFRPRLTEFSDITASSTFGINGVVAINTLGIDPSRGLQQLPGGLVDPSNRIDQKCAVGSGFRRSSFTVTGRGGLPENPFDPLQSGEDIASWVEVRSGSIPPSDPTQNSLPSPLIEADRVIVGKDGSVQLVASQSMAELGGSWQPTCDLVKERDR
ncbi:filamentous hemagglutinin N-terminal domain-containing protein [Leptolyngbyaceae cyanobacterium UHCC 1019]